MYCVSWAGFPKMTSFYEDFYVKKNRKKSKTNKILHTNVVLGAEFKNKVRLFQKNIFEHVLEGLLLRACQCLKTQSKLFF